MTEHVSDLQWDRLLAGELAAERDAFRLRSIAISLSRTRWRWLPALIPVAAAAAVLIALRIVQNPVFPPPPTSPPRRWCSPPPHRCSARAANLQKRVDDVLASMPGGHQVSATEIDYDGLIVTFDSNYSAEKAAVAPTSVTCSEGFYCIVVQGTTYSFFKCQMWDLMNWVGDAPYNNNQTNFAVARAYNQDRTREVAINTAKSIGIENVTSWWHFQPCGGPDLPGP